MTPYLDLCSLSAENAEIATSKTLPTVQCAILKYMYGLAVALSQAWFVHLSPSSVFFSHLFRGGLTFQRLSFSILKDNQRKGKTVIFCSDLYLGQTFILRRTSSLNLSADIASFVSNFYSCLPILLLWHLFYLSNLFFFFFLGLIL